MKQSIGGSGEKTETLDRKEGKRAKKLVWVRYLDHVLFLNMDPVVVEPSVRETVGWLVENAPNLIKISYDRPVTVTRLEKEQKESGLVILKDNIIETTVLYAQNLRSGKARYNRRRGH